MRAFNELTKENKDLYLLTEKKDREINSLLDRIQTDPPSREVADGILQVISAYKIKMLDYDKKLAQLHASYCN